MSASDEPTTGPWQVSEAEYFADVSCQSNSMMRVAARSIPEFHQRFVIRTMPAPKPSAEMHVGTLLHACVLEPEVWSARMVTEKVDGRTKAGKEYNARMAAYAEENPSSLFVSEDEEATVKEMSKAIHNHPEAAAALALEGVFEGAIRWRDEASGLFCKAKLDKVTTSGLVIDLKSTADVANFPYSAYRFDYHRQGAHYLAGAWAALNQDGPFLFVCVQSSSPYEVRTMVFGDEELALGRRQNARLLAELAECYRLDRWQSRYSGIETINYRSYQLNED